MPLAALMGNGNRELAHLVKPEPVLLPQHVCLIGTRSFETGEAELLKRLHVRIYDMAEVHKRGFSTVLQEAIAYVNQGTGGFGVSLDLDVTDPTEAPGVGSPEPNGLHAHELISALPQLARDPRLKGFELVEFNPQRDRSDKTFHVCCQILQAALFQGS
jgi:arginase